MTQSREKAKQAFVLLQNALEESESRCAELQDQLSSMSANPQDPAEKIFALRQEIEAIGRERDEWHTAANQLQDVVANERLKQKRLKDQVQSLESGPDKTNKKEINFWRQKADEYEAHRREYQQRILDLKNLVAELQDQHEAADSSPVKITHADLDRAQALLIERDHQLAETSAALEGARIEVQSLEERLNSQSSVIEQQESGQQNAIDALEAELSDRRQQILDMQTDHERQITELNVVNDQSRSELHQSVEKLRNELGDQTETSEQQIAELQNSLASNRDQIGNLESIIDASREHIGELETKLTSALENSTALEATIASSQDQLEKAEKELQQEKDRSNSLNEIANEKREELAQTSEKLEEMHERYEEAKWQLSKTKYFEKLVRRRKGLIKNLVSTIRSKQKASNTLKAGLDSLRRYKSGADARQQDSLRRIEHLEKSLDEARERLNQANNAKRASDAAQIDPSDTAKLRTQVSAQAEVIENLETDLKSARKSEAEARTKHNELEKLHNDLETKNTFIGTLQKDIEEQQKNAAQLRKREIEIRELSALVDERDKRLTSLEQENQQLRSVKSGEIESVDRQKLEEYEKSISQLSARLKEYEATIATLNDAADRWKRKYDFLTADEPYGFDAAARK